MELTVLGPLAGRSFAIAGKPKLLLLRPTNLPLLRLSLPLSLPNFSSSSRFNSPSKFFSPSRSNFNFRFQICVNQFLPNFVSVVFAAQESNLSVSNENETSEWLMQGTFLSPLIYQHISQ